MKISTHARNSPLISTKAKRRNGNAFSGVKSSLHWFLYCKEHHFRRGWGVLFLTWSQFFEREKELYVLNQCPKLAKTEFQNQTEPCTETFHLHHKFWTRITGSFHTANSCRVPMELISSLDCLQCTENAPKVELFVLIFCQYVEFFCR